jgi:hypothetical protein
VSSPPSGERVGAGRYRRQGSYRAQGKYLGHEQAQKPWRPPYNHLNKYYQVPTLEEYAGRAFQGNLSRSQLEPLQGGGLTLGGVSVPVLWPNVVVVPSEAAPREAPPAAPPQIFVIQPPPAPAPAPQEPALPPPAAPEPLPTEPVAVELVIRPADAEVYLDDRWLGTGSDLTTPRMLRPGVYVLAVEHPDYGSQRLVFGVGGQGPLRAVMDLTAQRPGRRARVETPDEIALGPLRPE